MEGGRSPGEQGVGEGGKWENRGRGESGRTGDGEKVGAEINKAIFFVVYHWY